MIKKKTKFNILNEKEYELYMIIKKYIEENNYSPSYRELTELGEYKSVSSIMLTLLKFEDLGFIKLARDEKGNVKSRTIIIIDTEENKKRMKEIKEGLGE